MSDFNIGRQTYQRIINITPDTLNVIFSEIKDLLKQYEYNQKFYHRLWKALFFGLWNYDKLIPQHELCEEISKLIHVTKKSKSINFIKDGFQLLQNYWNRIDHHRINKFMKLVRYFLRESIIFYNNKKIPLTQLWELLQIIIFTDLTAISGIGFHVLEIYCSVLQEAGLQIQIQYFDWIKELIGKSHSIQYREHIIECIYEKVKGLINEQQLQQQKRIIMEDAKKIEDQQIRKTFYNIYGFLRSPINIYLEYKANKKQQFDRENQNRKKKISKGKKKQIIKKKQNLKIKNKLKKKGKIMSKTRLQAQF